MALEEIVKKTFRVMKRTALLSALTFASIGLMGLTAEAVRDHAVLTGSLVASKMVKEKNEAKKENRNPRYLDEVVKGMYFGALVSPYIHYSYGLMNKYFPVDTIPKTISTGTLDVDKITSRALVNGAIYPAVSSAYVAPTDHLSTKQTTKGIYRSFRSILQIMKGMYLTAPLMLLNVFFASPVLHVPIAAVIGFLVDYVGLRRAKKDVPNESYSTQQTNQYSPQLQAA